MDGINLPEFLNTEEKYNKMIHEVDTLQKFEQVFLKLLSDEKLEMSSIMTLMKIIERDVILVNKLTEASSLMEVTESFIRYITLKEPGSPKKTDDQNKQEDGNKQTNKQPKKDVSNKPKKSPKDKKMKPAVEEQVGVWECDCGCELQQMYQK